MKKIAHFGAFDHDSYGDLLFPKIVEHMLPDFAITHVAPTAAAADWLDAAPILSLDEAIRRTDWDGILVGGGDIVQAGEWRTKKWRQYQAALYCGLPGLWMGAAFLSAKLNIPAAWNAPGVPAPFPDWFATFAGLAMDCTDYLAVRDARSRANLEPLTQRPITVVPDTALAIGQMWPRPEKEKRLVLSLSLADVAARSAEVNTAIRELAPKLGMRPENIVVAPLMRWEATEDSHLGVNPQTLIAAGRFTACGSLEATAHLIGGASGYIGNSLHGLITAVSYGVPAVLVVPVHNQQSQKYHGFLAAAGLAPADFIAADWLQAGDLLLKQKPVQIAGGIFSELNRHVESIRSLMNAGTVDKTGIWRMIRAKLHADSEQLCLSGAPPAHLGFLSRMHERELKLLANQVKVLNEDLALATTREQALAQALEAWQRSCCGRLSRMANKGLQYACAPVRCVRYLLDPRLRALASNTVERRWIRLRDKRKIRALPGLDWLLKVLELNASPKQVVAKLGPYLTRGEEAQYRAMIGPLQAAGGRQPSTVCRPDDPSATTGVVSRRRSILFVCGEFPNPVHGGGSRVADFVKALSVGHEVHVAAWYTRVADSGLAIIKLPWRAARCMFDPKLRERTLNHLERRWLVHGGHRKIGQLPGLKWLLAKLDLDIPVDQVSARLGAYLTSWDEDACRAMIQNLRSRVADAPSTVVRALDLPQAALTTSRDEKRRRILYVCGEFPNPIHGGGGHVADFIKMLSEQHDVYVAAWYDRPRDHQAFAELAPYCRALRGLSFEDMECGCVDKLLDVIGHEPVDIVHYEWPRSLNSFDRRLGRHHIFTHMESVSCSLWMDLHRHPPLSPDWMQCFVKWLTVMRIEAIDAGRADAQIVVTPKDGAFLSSFVPGQTYYVLNHGINIEDFSVPDTTPEPHTLVFVGNYKHPPNQDAVHYFMEQIWPQIIGRVPDARFLIVGANPPDTIQRYHDGARVVVTGRVPAVTPYVQQAAVCIAPLVSGAGWRNKVIQYAAWRRPCVVTPIAAEDVMLDAQQDFFVARDPSEFAARVLELLLDPDRARSMAEQAREKVLTLYDNRRIVHVGMNSIYRALENGGDGQ